MVSALARRPAVVARSCVGGARRAASASPSRLPRSDVARARGPFGISKEMRLRQRADFVAVQGEGTKVHGRHVLGIARRRADPELAGRLGFTVTKKVGNAVIRNRIKRLLREWMRQQGWVPRGWDLVLVAKDSAARQLEPGAFAPDLTRILRQLT